MNIRVQESHSVTTRFLTVLIAGFALLIVLLGASAWVGVEATRSTEATATRIVEEQRATLRLLDDIQHEQDSLSSIFYSLAVDQSERNRLNARRKLDSLEKAIRSTLNTGLSSPHPEHWQDVRRAVDAFIGQGRLVINSGKAPSAEFFLDHETLTSALANLAAVNFNAAAEAQNQQSNGVAAKVRSLLLLLGAGLLTALVGAVMTVRIIAGMYGKLEWQRAELAFLSSRAMADQEETARRFSRELHDEFGQTLSAIEANLVAMHNSRAYEHHRIDDALKMIKAAIGNAREMSQLLRPSILDDFGLDMSLRWLAETFSKRTGVQVNYASTDALRTDEETETQLFRIAQEALTNISRHADATLVRMELEGSRDALSLVISDNGKGLPTTKVGSGLGLVGMRARSRAAGGTLMVSSSPGNGVTITATVELKKEFRVTPNSHPSRG